MTGESDFTPNSPLTRKPKRSWLIVWVFFGLVGMAAAFVVADHYFGNRGGYVAAAAWIVIQGGMRALRWWAERSDTTRPLPGIREFTP